MCLNKKYQQKVWKIKLMNFLEDEDYIENMIDLRGKKYYFRKFDMYLKEEKVEEKK